MNRWNNIDKTKKIKTAIISVLIIIATTFAGFLIFSIIGLFNIFSIETPILLDEFEVDEQHIVAFYYSGGSTTTKSYIQVRKVDTKANKEYILDTYLDYSNLIGYCLEKDSVIILLNNGCWKENCQLICDTLYLNINDIKEEF